MKEHECEMSDKGRDSTSAAASAALRSSQSKLVEVRRVKGAAERVRERERVYLTFRGFELRHLERHQSAVSGTASSGVKLRLGLWKLPYVEPKLLEILALVYFILFPFFFCDDRDVGRVRSKSS